MSDFSIQIKDLREIPQAALVVVEGSIDFYTTGSFREEVETARSQRVKRMVLDLEGLTYINSSGISYIISLAGEGSPEAPSLVLLKVQPKIKVIFDMLKLGTHFKFCTTLEEAIETLKGKGPPTTIGGV